jgi:SAM-dependent methyltransferase
MVLAEMRRRGPGLRLLEVGGCCHPQMEGTGGELFNVDIDIQTLQVGALSPRRGEGAVHFIAADAADLPFVDAAFDGVVMFSTLHHFVDPAAVLGRLRRLVKPDGFIAVVCEPCSHARLPRVDPGYLRELEQGINEQSFCLEEYAQIFARAGLEAFELVVHYSSLKALLRPSAAVSAPGAAPLLPPKALPARPGPPTGRWRRLWARLRRAG